MILLTGATGPTGSHVLKHMVAAGLKVRAFVQREASVQAALAAGAVETIRGDLHSPADVVRALEGIEQVYFIAPRFLDTEVAITVAMIEAARTTGIGHFIYHSVYHAQLDAILHHRDKRICEAALFDSLLPYTILQPTMYMQSTTRDWREIVQAGRYAVPYSTEQRMTVVDLEDVGAAAAVVAGTTDFRGGCYELASGEQLSRAQMAGVMSEVLGRPVDAVRSDLAAWQAHQRSVGVLTEAQIERMSVMMRHYDDAGMGGGNGRVLGMILGRAPRRYRDHIEAMTKLRPQG